jgi:NADH-quinone oxidoreductase subunit K
MMDKLLTIGLEHFLILSGTLFFIGLFGVLSKKNVIAVLMALKSCYLRSTLI